MPWKRETNPFPPENAASPFRLCGGESHRSRALIYSASRSSRNEEGWKLMPLFFQLKITFVALERREGASFVSLNHQPTVLTPTDWLAWSFVWLACLSQFAPKKKYDCLEKGEGRLKVKHRQMKHYSINEFQSDQRNIGCGLILLIRGRLLSIFVN